MLRRPSHQKDAAAAISGVDQRLRECLQVLWIALPRDRVNLNELETHFRRLVDRAIRDFKEDAAHFPPEEDI